MILYNSGFRNREFETIDGFFFLLIFLLMQCDDDVHTHTIEDEIACMWNIIENSFLEHEPKQIFTIRHFLFDISGFECGEFNRK